MSFIFGITKTYVVKVESEFMGSLEVLTYNDKNLTMKSVDSPYSYNPNHLCIPFRGSFIRVSQANFCKAAACAESPPLRTFEPTGLTP
jgi:hypothetical protein